MKRILVSLTLLITSHISFAGNAASSVQKQKIKIANAQILTERAKKTDCSEEFLKMVKFFEIFADKEMDTDELNKGFSIISDNLWAEVKIQTEREVRADDYNAVISTMAPELNQQLAELKPILLGVLLQEDFPNLYAKLTEKK